MSAKLFACCVPGLSPLARGNPSCRVLSSYSFGPIPARAGEPIAERRVIVFGRAYPRSRGGTIDIKNAWSLDTGLSPLARGNQPQCHARFKAAGPIPARAGEPYCTAY